MTKTQKTHQAAVGNTVTINEYGKVMSVSRPIDENTYAVFRTDKNFVGYGTLQDGKLIVEVE